MFWPFSNVGLGESSIFDDFEFEEDIFGYFYDKSAITAPIPSEVPASRPNGSSPR